MQNPKNTIAERLIAFKQRSKFASENWEIRGLYPSSPELCQIMELKFNQITDELISQINKDLFAGSLKYTLKKGLKKFNKLDYDTEEKEFICDLFGELAEITGVDFGEELNKWLYGPLLNFIIKVSKLLNPEKVLETKIQPCSGCGTELETLIIKKEEGIPDYSWFIVKCNACKEFNLISPGPNIKQLKFKNYEWVESLNKDKYNAEKARTRLEQIKFFRK